MRLILKRLVLTNFKGIRSLDTHFGDVTNVIGPNGSGKTTIADAFFWLLFDKDSSNRSDFEIKTLDENNQPFHKLDHEVTAYLEIDGTETVIRKSLREKWTKPRGQKDEVFERHETSFFWNDVPLKKSEFQAKISAIINETTFKLLTNPLYFNTVMKWQDRRAMLMQIAGDIDNGSVFQALIRRDGASVYESLIAMMNKKSPAEIRAEIASKKKKLNDELALIAPRIDEANRSKPEPLDYEGLQKELEKLNEELSRVEDLLMNSSKQEKELQERQTDLYTKKQNLSRQMIDCEENIKNKVRAGQYTRKSEITEAKSVLHSKEADLRTAIASRDHLKEKIETLNSQREKLLSEYSKINEMSVTYDGLQTCCPTCNRDFDPETLDANRETIVHNFNLTKTKMLDANKKEGLGVKEATDTAKEMLAAKESEINDLEVVITAQKNKIEALQFTHDSLTANEDSEAQKAISNDPGYQKFKAELDTVNEALSNAPGSLDKSEFLNQKRTLNESIKAVEAKLNTRSQIEKIDARIAELMAQESNMSQELADLEGTEYAAEQFIKAKMDLVESRVNGMFQIVKFKMFEDQINGGQSETCVALINGVPFSDANTASKVNAGLDIINVLSRHFDFYGPIVIDNRESVINLIDTDAQVINLIADDCEKLTVKVAHKEALAAN